MTFSITLTMLFLLLTVLAFFRTPLYLWSTAGLALLVTYASTSNYALGSLFLLLVWTPVMLLNVPPLRRTIISDRLFPLMKKAIPPMSQTEQDAIAAGSVWWDAELFCGKPDWSKLVAYPEAKLSADEQAFLDGPVQQLCDMVHDWEITQTHMDLPPDVWRFIKEQGFFGMIIPKKFGGLGFSALGHSAVVVKVATRSISTAVTVMVPNSLGPAELLLQYGTPDQQNYYLPRLARGEEIPCFALTGPEAGSDAGSMPDSGVVCKGEYQGKKDVLGIRLSWSKRYITLGPVATLLGVAFKLYDPDHLAGDKDDIGITLALIPTDLPGVTIGQRHFPLNQAFMNGPNWGENVFIPMDMVIGGQKQLGEGWRMLMDCLSVGRSISLPALSTGGGKLASRGTGAYARIRSQFKMPIGKFEGVEEALARISAYTYMMDAARTLTAKAVDQGEKPSVTSAIVKYHLTETMRRIINDAMDVQGGSGISMGPRNFLGRVYQAIPISITVEGANILTRSMIIFGQGAIRCHPYVLKEMQALANVDEQEGLVHFDRAFIGHIGFTISNAVRSIVLGLSGGQVVRFGDERTRPYYQRLSHLSAALAFSADIAMLIVGGALKRKERLSARLGDVLSYLYLASAVLKRYEDQNRQLEDLPLVDWCLHDLSQRSQDALYEFYANFPLRPVGLILRWLTFPLGKRYHAPSDKAGHRAAALILEPSVARDRLTTGMHIPTDPEQTLAKLDQALPIIISAEPLEKKLQQAIRSGAITGQTWDEQINMARQNSIFSKEDLAILQQAHDFRLDLIQVDHFSNEEIRHPSLDN